MTHYAPFYCEENVWWLAQEPRFAAQPSDVVFVSNARRTVAVWGQRAARAPGEPVVWDYHVVLATRGERGVEVWDLDSAIGTPLPAQPWLDASFDPRAAPRFAPRFRVADAATFVARFASDRRHMRTPAGRWRRPPPPWPVIGDGAHTLEAWIDVHDETFGATIDLDALRRRWR